MASVDPVSDRQPMRRLDPVLVLAILGFLVLGAVAVVVAGYLLLAVGTTAAIVAFVMALVPLAIVLFAIRWIDQWEPEPRPALLFALLWGAAASAALALVFSFAVQILRAMSGAGESTGTMILGTVVQAPIVEEFSKGLGILILFWVFRRNFDGAVDGLVYGATIAVGFAFTENIQYFGLALAGSGAEGGVGGVGEIFFLRGILSPFAHVMFTACTGIVLGFASRRSGSVAAIGFFLLGLVPAILLHALWNGASLVVGNFYVYYAVVQVPLFLLGLSFVAYLRRQEQLISAERLAEYGRAGWFSPTEVALLSSAAGRNAGMAWARRHGLSDAYARFTKHATRLAFARQRIVSGRDRIGAQRNEADLLDSITSDRRALAALPPFPLAVQLH